MTFFKKNENETAYVGGQKHFIDMIKNTGDGDFLFWRQPEEDFNTKSKVEVMPGEVAVFVDGGNIAAVLESGTHELNTNNYPFIGRLKNSLSGGISTFNCVVFFVKKSDSKEIMWGTTSPISVKDKVYGIRTDVRARGAYKVRIENPALFIEKLIGSNKQFQDNDALGEYFNNHLKTIIRSSVTTFFNEYENELIGIDAYLDDISKVIERKVNETFNEYGLCCVNFSVSALDVDTEKYDSIDEAQVNAIKRVKEAEGEQAYMSTLGDNWDRMQSAKIMNTMAGNSGAGGIGTIGAGLGVGMAAGGAFTNMANQMFAPMTEKQNQSSEHEDPMEALGKLKKMLEAELISQADYDSKKEEILKRM